MKKKIILIVVFFVSLTNLIAQYTVSKNGVIYDENGQHVKVEDFKNILSGKPGMIKLYESGRNKKDFGNSFMIGGLALGIGSMASAMYGAASPGEQPSIALPLVGGGLFVAGGLMKIGFRKKIKQAVEALNESNASAMNYEMNYEIVSNNNGLGIRINF